MIEHINTIDALKEQIRALLDLIMMSEKSVDHKSIKTASEMALTIFDDLCVEIDEVCEIARRPVEEVRTAICDDYCRYTNGADKAVDIEERCKNCPLKKLGEINL